MLKKTIISLLGIGAFIVIFMYAMDWNWGEVKSEIHKTDYQQNTDTNSVAPTNHNLSLFDIGTYKASHQQQNNLELLFNIDGLNKTTGRFDSVEVILNIKEPRNNSTLTVNIKTNSIFTDNKMRDKALVSEEFFNAQKFPLITFHSDSLVNHNKQMTAYGKLTLMQTTKPLNFPFKILGKTTQNNQTLIGVSGTFQLDRTKYGMPHETGVGDIVTLSFYIDFKA